MDRSARRALTAVVAFLILLVVWEMVVVFGPFNETLFPGPGRVAKAFLGMLVTGRLLTDTGSSMSRLFFGFAIGSVFGIIIGVITAKIPVFEDSAGQILHFSRFVPPLALVPLAILWLGIGEISKIALIAWTVFFPVWLNTVAGILDVEEKHMWAAKSLGASQTNVIKEVVLPASLPFVMAGARIGLGVGFSVLIAAEMAGAFAGLGFRISLAHQVFSVDKMLAGIILLGVLGVIADKALSFSAKKLMPWHKEWGK